MTPYKLFLEEVNSGVEQRTKIIKNGTYEIGEVNAKEIITILKEFT